MKRRLAMVGLGTVGLLAITPMAQADDVDVAAWLQANKDTVEFFLDVDVDTCKGLQGLTYEQSVALADAEGIDLKELAKQTDPDTILEYVNNSGVTLADIDRFLTAFCAGDVTPPPVASTSPGYPTGDPTSGVDSPSSSAPAGAKDDKSSPSVSPDEVNGKMADTGGLSPWVPTGLAVGAAALGGSAYYWARKTGRI